jgi:hypothetical protein
MTEVMNLPAGEKFLIAVLADFIETAYGAYYENLQDNLHHSGLKFSSIGLAERYEANGKMWRCNDYPCDMC